MGNGRLVRKLIIALDIYTMKFKNLFTGLTILLLISNCSSGGDDISNEPDPDPTTITYNNKVKAIINGNCGSCHGNPTNNGAPISYTNFTQVKNDINDIISRINSSSNPMPPTGLIAQSLRDDIQKWKDDGLLEN